MTSSRFRSLQDFVDGTPDLVEYFYNDTVPQHASFRPGLTPIPQEWTNWREEQRAWRETAILFDQSHHMPELFVKGPDAFRFLNHIGVNSFKNFSPGKAKQFVGCNPSGQIIGECILYYNDENEFELVSGMHFQNWIRYQAEIGDFDLALTSDLATADNPHGRTKFRFGLDGPNASGIFEEAVGGNAPAIPFFNTARVQIANRAVTALRHGMAGHKGVELSGRYEDGPAVREALLAVGEKFGLRRGGTTAYFSTLAESGWMAYPVPAIYTGEEMRAFREWLPANSWEVRVQLGGSFKPADISACYVTPWDFGLDRLVKFDHDFIGREALETLAATRRRTAVSLVWNQDDLARVSRSLFEDGLPCKHITYPIASYATQHHDEVRTTDGQLIGLATYAAYTINERQIISLATIDLDHAREGTEVLITWGEADGGSRKPHVERHRQTRIRACVAPKPYARTVQKLRNSSLSPA